MNHFTRISTFFVLAVFVLLFAQSALAAPIVPNTPTTISCSGTVPTYTCNESCTGINKTTDASDTLTEDRSFYFDGGWMGSYTVWNDVLGYSQVVNGLTQVDASAGNASCGNSATGGSGTLSLTPLTTGIGDTDTVEIRILAQNKKNTSAAPKIVTGSTTYMVYTIGCQSGQYTLNNRCVNTDGNLKLGAGFPQPVSHNTLVCTEPCNPEVKWTTFGIGTRILRDDQFTGSVVSGASATSGDVPDSGINLSAGVHSYFLQAKDGFNVYRTVDSVAVFVNSATAELSLSKKSFQLTPSALTDSGTISNINTTNGGSFTVGAPGCTYVSGTGSLANSNNVFMTCPSSTGSFSATVINNPSTAGAATFQVHATPSGSTLITNNDQLVTVTYAPAASDCNLNVTTTTVNPGGLVTFVAETLTNPGQQIDWYGTNPGGSQIGPIAGQTSTPDNETYQYNQLNTGTYTRYFKIHSGTQCSGGQSNTVTVVVNPAVAPSALTCNVSPTQSIGPGPYHFHLYVGGAKPGYNYDWHQPCNITAHDSNYQWIDVDCNPGVYGASVTQSSDQTIGATCPQNFCAAADVSQCVPPSGGTPGSLLSAAEGVTKTIQDYSCDEDGNNCVPSGTHQQYQLLEPYAISITWPAPLNEVSLKLDFPGTMGLYGANGVRFSCKNDGTYVTVPGNNIGLGICNYTSPGTYTAYGEGVNNGSTNGVYCYDHPCNGTATIIVGPTIPPTVTLTQIATGNPTNTDLRWTVSHATSCTANSSPSYVFTNSPWDGNKSTLGGDTIIQYSAMAYTTNFGITCTGPGGSDSKSVIVTKSGDVFTSAPSVTPSNYCAAGAPGGTVSWQYSWGNYQPSACQVQVADNSSFNSPVVNVSKSTTACQTLSYPTYDEDGNINGYTQGSAYPIPTGTLQYNKTYYVRAMAWDQFDQQSNWSQTTTWATPKHQYPSVNFSYSPSSPQSGSPVQFTDSTTFFDGGGTHTWSWNFGDTSNSTTQNPTHTYTNANAYTVSDAVTDKDGYLCAATQPLTIPTANGVCGSANKTYPSGSSSYGSDTYCSQGTPSSSPAFPSAGSSVNWICNGSGIGSPSGQCTASQAVSSGVGGICGTASKIYPAGSTSYGSDTYCSQGTPSSSPAFPSAGSSANWTCSGTPPSGQCTASVPSQYSVTVQKTNGGSVASDDGSISCGNTCSSTYPQNTSVTLTATPDSSYWQFSGWSGDCNGTGQCILTVNSAKNVFATFTPRSFNYQEF